MLSVLYKILITALPSIFTGIVLGLWTRRQNRRDKTTDQREAERREYELVQLDLLVATAELSRANAVALRDGKTNGETKEGLRRYNEAIERFHKFEREKIAEEVN